MVKRASRGRERHCKFATWKGAKTLESSDRRGRVPTTGSSGSLKYGRWAGRARERQSDRGVLSLTAATFGIFSKLSNQKYYFNKLFSLLRLPYPTDWSHLGFCTSTHVMPRQQLSRWYIIAFFGGSNNKQRKVIQTSFVARTIHARVVL